MPYIIQDRIELSLFLNGVDYPLESLNVLNYLHMAWSVRTMVPTLSFSITDQVGMIKSQMVQDYVPISVVIKPMGSDTSVTYNFRKFSHKKSSTVFGTQYEVTGVWDSIPYWFTTSSKGITGNSNDVISQIAGICGLKYDGLATNDNQLWLPANTRYCEFIRNIATSGWANDKSLMCGALGLDGILHYKDLNNLPSPTKHFVLGEIQEGKGTFVDFSPKTMSGFTNKLTGYSDTMYYQSASANPTSYSQLSFTPDSASPLYNQQVKGQAGRGKQRYSPIDFGNVHVNYEKAKYQNVRYANLLNYDAEFLSIYQSGITPFEKFNFSAMMSDGSTPDPEVSGEYMLASQVIYVQGPNYYEKLEGMRHGDNTPQQQNT